MAIDLMIPVSARQFAKMIGVASDNAVRKAVERGSILKGYTSDKKLIPKIAAQEWGKEILPEYGGKPSKPVAKKSTPVKPKQVTADDVVKEVLNEIVPKKKVTDQISNFFSDDDDSDDEDEHEEGWISKPEAERRTAIHKSEILEIALAEKRGQLIPKEKLSTILFGYGQEIRVSFEGLTNRVLDKVLASESRHEAKRIMDEEIHAMLMLLSEIPNREI